MIQNQRIDELYRDIQNTDLVVHAIWFKEEMFFSSDIQVKAEVIQDNHPVGTNPVGSFHTELFRMSAPKDSPVSYKSTGWKNEDGSPIPPSYELSKVLSLSLRATLINRWGAELYELNNSIDFPSARVTRPSLWNRLKKWMMK